mmetsp:Transcript_110665/g.236376  ORF Transcript_110665/g.236376 Transcript_110665/m.236376 type:complete len:203 (-) Transcript_110665:744-1352(-)
MHDLVASQGVGVAQLHPAARRQALEARHRLLHEVLLLDEEFWAEGQATCRQTVLRWQLYNLAVAFVVGHDHAQGLEYTEELRTHLLLQCVPHTALQKVELDYSGGHLGYANELAELPQGRSWIAAAAHSREGGHAGVVPPVHEAPIHELFQLALGDHDVRHLKPRELVLSGQGLAVQCAKAQDTLIEPVVELVVHIELQRAD